jgi:hypothetical protein
VRGVGFVGRVCTSSLRGNRGRRRPQPQRQRSTHRMLWPACFGRLRHCDELQRCRGRTGRCMGLAMHGAVRRCGEAPGGRVLTRRAGTWTPRGGGGRRASRIVVAAQVRGTLSSRSVERCGHRGLCPSHRVPWEGPRPRDPQEKADTGARAEPAAPLNRPVPLRAPAGREGRRPRRPQEYRAQRTAPLPAGVRPPNFFNRRGRRLSRAA